MCNARQFAILETGCHIRKDMIQLAIGIHYLHVIRPRCMAHAFRTPEDMVRDDWDSERSRGFDVPQATFSQCRSLADILQLASDIHVGDGVSWPSVATEPHSLVDNKSAWRDNLQ